MKNILMILFGLIYCSVSVLLSGWFMQYVYTGNTPMNFAVCFVGIINAIAGVGVIIYTFSKEDVK